ncbi:hypothetical protein L3V82_02650 [Thiotrichales bacterium 19S3-7]|nr:hypothetical protein [Thiotrichales bacterium 19S3-7]MCF6801068.1 hypothetical protein [Thiotrichales bacterium 19S3-11]
MLCMIQLVCYLIGVFSTVIIAINLWYKLFLLLIITVMLLIFFIKKYLKLGHDSISSLVIKDQQYQIQLHNRQSYQVKLLPSSMISRFYIAIDLEVTGLNKVYRLFILRDMLASEAEFRLLARSLKL